MFRACVIAGMIFIVSTLTACGDRKNRASFQSQIAEAMKEPDIELRAKQLTRIGYQQGKAQDMAGAEETLRLAGKESQNIENPAARAGAYALLAEAYVTIDDRIAAKRESESAATAAAKVAEVDEKARSLNRVARAQGIAGESAAAADSLKTAESLAERIEDSQDRAILYCAIAKTNQRLARTAERDRLLSVALKFADSLADRKKQCMAIAEVAAQQAEFGEQDAAAKTFSLALESADKIDDPYFRAYALSETAERLADAGFRVKAREVLNRAEEATKKVKQQDMQMQVLEKIRSLMDKIPAPQE